NYWPDEKCAKAFWNQHEFSPYQELLRDTGAWVAPQPGERWLDLGCGGGQLTKMLWNRSDGQVAEILGVDCAVVNAEAYARLQRRLTPPPRPGQVRFQPHDFSHGFADWPSSQFDGVVCGLALQYAESYSPADGRWTQAAYDQALAEVFRLLKPGGTFVFSVNVPQPKWSWVALKSLPGMIRRVRSLRFLKRAWRLYRYGSWLSREAKRGRFHYLPWETIEAKLQATGFIDLQMKLSFARQAYLIRCRKP
ncbi:MAG: class I SAM-dependent methyltransferase, partial [Gemmataceae bacterium]|nr:class I SAM-dependent methyltransferase [Gemmataceae bacterium]